MPRVAKNTIPANVAAIQKTVTNAKGQAQREWRISGRDGLTLITQPSGTASWWFIYRLPGAKQQKLKLGAYTAVTLAEATQKAREALAQVGNGIDPGGSKRPVAGALTFEELATRFLAENPRLAASTRTNYAATLKADTFPHIGTKAATAVTTDDVVAICRVVKDRGALVHAQRVKAIIGGVYRWAIRNSLMKTNPTLGVPNQQELASSRDRVPTAAEIGMLWRTIDATPRLSRSMKLIVKLAILTGQRRGEVAGARVDELKDDTWTIAADAVKAGRIVTEGRMKNGRQQVVYLSRQAKALFDEAMTHCSDGTYLFPADTSRHDVTRVPHINGESVSRAIRREREKVGINDLTIHDMRRGITSYLDEQGVDQRLLMDMLHHTPGDVMNKHYNRADRSARLRDAWQLWADYVEDAVAENGAADVIGSG